MGMTNTEQGGTIRLIGIGNVPAVPLSDVKAGDRITWNYGQTYTVVRNTKVAANTYELVERGDDGREWTRRKRGTKLVARRAAAAPADELTGYENLGWEAHRNGGTRAPALNAEVMAAIGDAPVGEPRTVAIMRAFSRGYDAAIQDELTALGF